MRYAEIKYPDSVNGLGVRVSLFVQGCSRKCNGCFNQETWDADGGYEFRYDAIKKIYYALDNQYCNGLSVLGGEPLDQSEELMMFLEDMKMQHPDKSVWLWTGNYYKDVKDTPTLKFVDVIVDGPYVENLRVPVGSELYGSCNQNVIPLTALGIEEVREYERLRKIASD